MHFGALKTTAEQRAIAWALLPGPDFVSLAGPEAIGALLKLACRVRFSGALDDNDSLILLQSIPRIKTVQHVP